MTTGIGAESVVVESWLDATLKADAPLAALVSSRVYLDLGPDTATYPFVSYTESELTDLRIIGADRVWTDTVYIVKATAQADSYLGLAEVASAIEAALTTTTGAPVAAPNPTGLVLECYRENPFRMSEFAQGYPFRHLGGFYRIKVQGS